LFGACVLSWRQSSGAEILYTRRDAIFDGAHPIAGGIPICFPIFGPPDAIANANVDAKGDGDVDGRKKMKQHGFARGMSWSVASTSADWNPDDRDPSIELTLHPTEETLQMWPHRFEINYAITLHRETLQTDLRVVNKNNPHIANTSENTAHMGKIRKSFTFTAALHGYFEVASVSRAGVLGLGGRPYLDKTLGDNPATPVRVEPQGREEDVAWLSFVPSAAVDRIYPHTQGCDVVLDVGTGAGVRVASMQGWEDTVVWNPGPQGMPDQFDNFACVENAVATEQSAVTLAPGMSWRARTEFQVIDL